MEPFVIFLSNPDIEWYLWYCSCKAIVVSLTGTQRTSTPYLAVRRFGFEIILNVNLYAAWEERVCHVL